VEIRFPNSDQLRPKCRASGPKPRRCQNHFRSFTTRAGNYKQNTAYP